jgi:hypothetical protein
MSRTVLLGLMSASFLSALPPIYKTGCAADGATGTAPDEQARYIWNRRAAENQEAGRGGGRDVLVRT